MAIYRKSLPLYKEVPDHLVRVPGTRLQATANASVRACREVTDGGL